MNEKLAKKLIETAENYDSIELELYENYSGRGMYGETTTGIVCDSFSELMVVGFVLGVYVGEDESCHDDESFALMLETLRWDNLGRRIIFY